MKRIILITLLWLAVINVFALVAHNRLNLSPDTAYTWIMPNEFPTDQSWNLVDMRNRWDAFWYLDVVDNGYHLNNDNTLSNAVFFPLYPALIKVVGTILLGQYALAGWLVSMACLVLAVTYFYRLLREFHPDIEPEWPIFFMLAFPTAFFFTVIYTESIFLLLTLAVFYYSFKGRFATAGLVAFAGAMTHSNGLFFALPILWEMWRTKGFRELLTLRAWPVVMAPLGTFAFVLFDYIKFGDPMLFFKIQSAWGRSFHINWEHFSLFSHPSIVNMGLDIFFALFIIGATVAVWRTLSPLYAVFIALTVFAALSSGTLMSIGRYSLVMFPVYILLARIKSPLFRPAWIFASTLFLALYTVLFVNNYWAG